MATSEFDYIHEKLMEQGEPYTYPGTNWEGRMVNITRAAIRGSDLIFARLHFPAQVVGGMSVAYSNPPRIIETITVKDTEKNTQKDVVTVVGPVRTRFRSSHDDSHKGRAADRGRVFTFILQSLPH